MRRKEGGDSSDGRARGKDARRKGVRDIHDTMDRPLAQQIQVLRPSLKRMVFERGGASLVSQMFHFAIPTLKHSGFTHAVLQTENTATTSTRIRGVTLAKETAHAKDWTMCCGWRLSDHHDQLGKEDHDRHDHKDQCDHDDDYFDPAKRLLEQRM